MWPSDLSVRLPIVALVSRCLTNWLIGRGPISYRYNLWRHGHVASTRYGILLEVSLGYLPVRGRLPTRYSPVRRCPLIPSSEESFMSFSLDLHVLGTPPAFILSQDRTLR